MRWRLCLLARAADTAGHLPQMLPHFVRLAEKHPGPLFVIANVDNCFEPEGRQVHAHICLLSRRPHARRILRCRAATPGGQGMAAPRRRAGGVRAATREPAGARPRVEHARCQALPAAPPCVCILSNSFSLGLARRARHRRPRLLLLDPVAPSPPRVRAPRCEILGLTI